MTPGNQAVSPPDRWDIQVGSKGAHAEGGRAILELPTHDDGDVLVRSGQHVVHVYERDDALVLAVAGYLGEALVGGDPVLVIATRAHRDALERALCDAGVDVPAMRMSGRYVTLDAERLLRRLLAEGRLEPKQFGGSVGGLLRSLAAEGTSPRVYGEMSALLSEAGRLDEALQLEGLWNDLGRGLPCTRWCGYPAHVVAEGAARESVCDRHDAVVPERHQDAWSPDHVSGRFEPTPSAARAVRQLVVEALEDWGQEALVDSTALVVSELAANAIRHGGHRFRVTVSAAPNGLRIEVTDPSTTVPAVREAGEQATGGRGLHLVEALCARWGTEVHDGGKTVWAEVPARPSA